MKTFKQYCVNEGRLGSMMGAAAMTASSLHGGFVDDWSKNYQTSNDPAKERRAQQVIDSNYTVPPEAERAIQIAASIFAGDEGKTHEQLVKYLRHTGAVESGYRTKVQVGGGPARSYWQVEPATAMDLVKNSGAYFGSKFHKHFGENALRNAQQFDKQKWTRGLERYDVLGATMAAAKWIASGWDD
jgi:hypothetical protein